MRKSAAWLTACAADQPGPIAAASFTSRRERQRFWCMFDGLPCAVGGVRRVSAGCAVDQFGECVGNGLGDGGVVKPEN